MHSASSVRNPIHVERYLQKEMTHGAMVGPFSEPPFVPWCRNNPLLTRPKKDSQELRVILDLSFPLGASVNSGIPRDSLDGSQFKLRLPSPLDLARLIVDEGPGCLICKIDLSRAYRQLRGDPLDWPLMGVTWEGQSYIDLAVPFGLRHGASACQRTSEAAGGVASHKHGSKTVSYVDDTAGAAAARRARAQYQGVLSTFGELGLDMAAGKCQAIVWSCYMDRCLVRPHAHGHR